MAAPTATAPLSTGAEARLRNDGSPLAAVLVNGGTGKAVPGTLSATSELLADELAPQFPDVLFVEVRYRVKSWNELPSCMADGAAAVELALAAGAAACLLVGFSMGGAVSAGIAGHDAVPAVLGLAPWFPERLSLAGLAGKRLDVVHGAWDRYLPGIPGVSPESSRAGFERARRLGAHGSYSLIPRAVHGAALRSPAGSLVRLPRWRAWVEHAAEALARFRSTV
jgi:hypothetical protein